MANLVGLCWHHHHLVHEGGWTITGNADGELTFASPGGGRKLTGRPPPLRPDTYRRARHATGAPVADPAADDDAYADAAARLTAG